MFRIKREFRFTKKMKFSEMLGQGYTTLQKLLVKLNYFTQQYFEQEILLIFVSLRPKKYKAEKFFEPFYIGIVAQFAGVL